ncbi:MAG: FtsB family cell division protein [Nocardioidaceae bacterium]
MAPTTRRTSRVAPAPGQTPAPRSRAKLTGRAAILCLVIAVLAVSYASSARAWLKQRNDENALRSQIVARTEAVAELEQAKRRWHDPAYVETQARLRFGWVMPGQTGYRVIGANGKILSDGSSQLSAPTNIAPKEQPAWWQSAWGSVVEAGKSPAQVAAESRPSRQPVAQIGGMKGQHSGGTQGPSHSR